MKSRNLKIIAIVFILIIDIVFAVLISNRINYEQYYNSEDLNKLYSLLEESHIVLNNGLMSNKKVKINAYACRNDINALEEIVKRNYKYSNLVKSNNELSFDYENGNMMFTTESYIKYLDNDYLEESIEYLIQVNDISSELINSLTKKVKDFLSYTKLQKDRLNRNTEKCEIVMKSLNKTRRGNYYLTFSQYFGTHEITSTLSVIISNDTIVKIQGDMFVLFPVEQLKTENASLIDILLSEKRYFDNQFEQKTMTLYSIDYLYEFCYDGYSKYYLIPICNLTYTDGEVRQYDYVTGYNQVV